MERLELCFVTAWLSFFVVCAQISISRKGLLSKEKQSCVDSGKKQARSKMNYILGHINIQ